VETERQGRGPRESGVSRGTIIIGAILAVAAVAVVLYFLRLSNRIIMPGAASKVAINVCVSIISSESRATRKPPNDRIHRARA
jgi:hypothetical protein